MNKILIIEDEKPLMAALKSKLRTQEYSILEATNGEEGMKMALEEHPDLIILDILMPVMDGMDFLEKLREDEWGKDANIMLLTNLSDEERMKKAKEQGVTTYMIKSDHHIEEVARKVDELLK